MLVGKSRNLLDSCKQHMPLLDTREKDRDLTGRLISDIILQLLSYCSQKERENIRQRQAEGIAAAKARGVSFGRPMKDVPDNFGALVRQWERKQLSFNEVLAQCGGMSQATFYNRLRDYRFIQANKP